MHGRKMSGNNNYIHDEDFNFKIHKAKKSTLARGSGIQSGTNYFSVINVRLSGNENQ